MRERNRELIVAVIAAQLLSLSYAAAQAHPLVTRATERGTVRVLVKLRGSFSPEGLLSQSSAASQRQVIRRLRRRVLDRVSAYGATRVRGFRRIPFVAMEVDAAGLSDLLSNPDVVSVMEDRAVPPLEILPRASPERTDVTVSPNLLSSTGIIGAPQAWDLGFTGSGQAVAVLDSGVDSTHSFLIGKTISEACYSTNDPSFGSTSVCPGGVESSTAPGSGRNCDPSISGCDHGTHVAGIVAGTSTTLSGVAKEAKLVAIQVFSRFNCASGPCALSWSSDQIAGMERVLDLSSTMDIAAVNMSLGGGGYSSTAACDADNSAIKAAIDNLRSVGIATVIAAGNDGFTAQLSAPGCISSAVSVGSTSDVDRISWFSNQAPFLSFYAPGENIVSSVLFGAFSTKTGTSMATPHVAGAWAVLKQKNPSVSVDVLLQALHDSGVPLTSSLGSWTTPRINVRDALGLVPGPDPRMSVDGPTAGSSVTWPFRITGWAVDLGAASGTGVDAVHVWAKPVGGGPSIFLGGAALGLSAPAAGASFGPQFQPSAFELESRQLLAPGDYLFEVYARSTVTGSFDNVQTVPVTVQAFTQMFVDEPLSGAVLGPGSLVRGWAFDTGDPGSTGIDAVHVWAYPASGPPTFVGGATIGVSRPGVASFFGVPEFQNAGFRLTITKPVPHGAYTLRFFARNTVDGTFNAVVDRSVSFLGPLMFVDTPSQGATVSTSFRVRGWAFDSSAPSGTGVDAVHVWAFPTDGAPAVFLGGARIGISRPDVAVFFNDTDLALSGYELDVNGTLAPGAYTIYVYARSTVSGTFNNSLPVAVTVQ